MPIVSRLTSLITVFVLAWTTSAAAEPEASPDVVFEQVNIDVEAIWPMDGATIPTMPEIWVEFEPVILLYAAFVEVESGVEHLAVILDAHDPEFGFVAAGRLVAFQPAAPLPPDVDVQLEVFNLEERVTLGTFTTTSVALDPPALPQIRPVVSFDGRAVNVALIREEDFDDDVLAALVAVDIGNADGFDWIPPIVFSRDVFRPSGRYTFKIAQMEEGETYEVCVATGVARVDQLRSVPDTSALECESRTVTDEDWAAALREDEEQSCSHTGPVSSARPSAELLAVFFFAHCLRRRRLTR